MIGLGVLVCLGTYFAGRAMARRLLRVPGIGVLSKQADAPYFGTSPARRLGFRVAGPAAAYLLCAVLVFAARVASPEREPSATVDVLPGGPAAVAGMESGDRILAVGAVETPNWPAILAAIGAVGPAHPVSLRVRRDQTAERTIVVTTNDGGKISVRPRMEVRPAPLPTAFAYAAGAPITLAAGFARSSVETMFGSTHKDLLGPVGIVREVSADHDGERRGQVLGFLLWALAFPASAVWPMTVLLEVLLTPRRRRPATAG